MRRKTARTTARLAVAACALTAFAWACGSAPETPAHAPPGQAILYSWSYSGFWAVTSLDAQEIPWRPTWRGMHPRAAAASRDGRVAIVTSKSNFDLFMSGRTDVDVFEGEHHVGTVVDVGQVDHVAFGREGTVLILPRPGRVLRIATETETRLEQSDEIELDPAFEEHEGELVVAPNGLRALAVLPKVGLVQALLWDPLRRTYLAEKAVKLAEHSLQGRATQISNSLVTVAVSGNLHFFRWKGSALERTSCVYSPAEAVALASNDTAYVANGGSKFTRIDVASCTAEDFPFTGKLSGPRTGCGPDGREVLTMRSSREFVWAYLDELNERRFHTLPFGTVEQGGREAAIEVMGLALPPCPGK